MRIDINTKAGKAVSVMQCPDCGVLQVKVDCVRAGVCLGPAVAGYYPGLRTGPEPRPGGGRVTARATLSPGPPAARCRVHLLELTGAN